MDPVTLDDLADTLLTDARAASNGRAARSVRPGRGHRLRQTLMALTPGHGLDDHTAPGEATLQVVRGRIRLRWGGGEVELAAGDLAGIPDETHAVDVLDEAVILLTIALPG